MEDGHLSGISGREKPVLFENKIVIFTCLGLALYWVVFLWNFWHKDVYVLGLNATIFLLAGLAILYQIYPDKKMLAKKNYTWLIPLVLIALSFAIYENPFIKALAILVFPVLVVVFFNYSQLGDELKKFWGVRLIIALIARALAFIGNIFNAFNSYFNLIKFKNPETKVTTKKVIVGIILLVAISLIIVLPLLSSADKVFAGYVNSFYDWAGKIVSLTFINKTIVFIVWSILFLSLAISWKNKFDYQPGQKEKTADSIIAGIILAGILVFYLLFLFIQLKYLWVRSLPVDFRTTETLVKSGFWQLFALSVLNIILFFFTFRKTNAIVQKILAAFTVASLFLLVSAGYRMGMYVFYYGFSYEKFYASYVVVFCALLFLWLLSRFLAKNKTDVVKFLAYLFLWMFALVTVFPVEQFVLRANIALSKNKDTRINLVEMSMLSTDVLGIIRDKSTGDPVRNIYCRKDDAAVTCEAIDWSEWVTRQEDIIKNKKWYEKNLGNF